MLRILLALSPLLLLASGHPKAGDHLLSLLGAGYERAESEHFVAAVPKGYGSSRWMLGRMEATYQAAYRLAEKLKVPVDQPERPLEVLMFAGPDEFQRYAQHIGFPANGTMGFYHADSHRSAFFDPKQDPRLEATRQALAEARERVDEETDPREKARQQAVVARASVALQQYERQIGRMILQHEIAHHLLTAMGIHSRTNAKNPFWLLEGMACLFEPPLGTGEKLPDINEFRLADLRAALAIASQQPHIDGPAVKSAIEKGRLLPLSRLVGVANDTPPQQLSATAAYAQSWSLAHFLVHQRPEAMGAYVQALQDGRPPTAELFNTHFGDADAKVQPAWIRWLTTLSAPSVGGYAK